MLRGVGFVIILRGYVAYVRTNYRQLLLYIPYDKNNLYMFVTSKNFLVPITTTLSAQTYSSTFCVSNLTIFVIL